MATETLSPLPKQKFFANNGEPAAKYRIFTYSAGTTTKLATYTDSSGSTPNANPIILDYRGECDLWVPPNVNYKYVLCQPGSDDPPTSSIWTVDNIVNNQLITLYGGVDTGIADAYVINFVSNFSSYSDGIVVYWIPSHTNTGSSTINMNGLGVVNITNQDGTPLKPTQLIANNVVGILYKGSGFILLNINAVGLTPTINIKNATYTFGIGDAYNIVLHTDSSAYNYNIPDDSSVAFAVGTSIQIINQSSNTLSIFPLGGVNFYPFGQSVLASSFATLSPSTATYITKTGANTWIQSTLTSATVDSSAYVGTITGLSATVTGTIFVRRIGQLVTLISNSGITATSNSTAMTLTGMPANFRPLNPYTVPSFQMQDNSVQIGGWATIATSGVVTFGSGINGNSTGFTAAGTKGINPGWTITFPIG